MSERRGRYRIAARRHPADLPEPAAIAHVPVGPSYPAMSRTGAIAWARSVVVNPFAVYLDTETTGLGPDAEIVDVAVVAGDGRILLDTLVRPAGSIPPDASRIHGIRDVDVHHAPEWPDVHAALCALLDGRTVVVYNVAFDRRIVTQCADRHGLVHPPGDWQCAMQAFARFGAEPTGVRGRYRWRKLEEAVACFGAAPGGHRALGDALACRAVVVGMAATDE